LRGPRRRQRHGPARRDDERRRFDSSLDVPAFSDATDTDAALLTDAGDDADAGARCGTVPTADGFVRVPSITGLPAIASEYDPQTTIAATYAPERTPTIPSVPIASERYASGSDVSAEHRVAHSIGEGDDE
jgi:hypothetical protein